MADDNRIVSNNILTMTEFNNNEEIIVRESIRIFITDINPRGIKCTKEIWNHTSRAWEPFQDTPLPAPTTKLDLNLSHLKIWESVTTPGGKSTREVIQVRFELDPGCGATFDRQFSVTSGDAKGEPFLRHADMEANHGLHAIFSSLRRGEGDGALPFNLGLVVRDGTHSMLVFYDPKIENDGSILSPPPPPPPPPPPWP